MANSDKFVAKYKDKLNNPIMLGYLIHILTDRFYNEYIFKKFYIYDKEGNGIGIYLKGKKKLLDDNTRKNLKHRELNIYDKWLLNHNYVIKFKNFNCIDNVIDIDEATFNKEKLMKYILSANKDLNKNKLFTKLCFYNYKITNQEELNNIFYECINYIFEYINKL